MRFEHKAFWVSLPLCLLFAVASCGSDDDDGGGGNSGGSSGSGGSGATGGSGGSTGGTGGTAGGSTGGASGSGGSATGGSAGAAAFELTSSAYSEGGNIPAKYECSGSASGGTNVSPPLAWTAGPTGTQSYAIIMRDLDFSNGFLHWVMWDIPAATLALPEDVEQVFEPSVPAGAKQAPFTGNQIGYFGPCSPNSVNTYEITVYALPDATLPGLDENSSKTEAADAIVGAALGSAKLSGES